MVDRIDIKGGADEFEAAVIIAVIEEISRENRIAGEGRQSLPDMRFMSSWVRAISGHEPMQPREIVRPQ